MTGCDQAWWIGRAEHAYDQALGSGDPNDLAQALSVLRQALAATPLEHPDGVWCRLSLATVETYVFKTTADLAVLNDAIVRLGELTRVLPRGDVDRRAALVNLASALADRYGFLTEPADLLRAVDAIKEALVTQPHDALLLTNLCILLHDHYRRTSDPADLDEAIDTGERAVDFAPPGAGYRHAALGNLGTARLSRYRLRADVDDIDDLEAAIALLRQAIEPLPPDTLDHVVLLAKLAEAWRDRFTARGDPADLDRAIHSYRLVTRRQLAHRSADALTGLGNCLGIRARATGSARDLDEAIATWRTAAATPGQARMRFIAAALAATNLSEHGRPAEAVEDYATAVGLLPLLAWRGLDRPTRENLLAQSAGLGPEAAASAIAAGEPERAVELLEQGRSVLWGQLLDTRTDLTALREAHPDIAARLGRLAAQLDTPSEDPDDRRRVADAWDVLLDRIRTLDGFSLFLLPTPFEHLSRAAARGPVVIVNVSRFRCDALVVGVDGVRVIPLPALTSEDVTRRASQCLAAAERLTREGHRAARQTIFACLEWLWDVCASEVLDALGHTSPPPLLEGDRPRIWWSATGMLTYLPLHAAGYHDPDDERRGDTVLDRVMSSYTPNLRALAHALRPDPVTPGAEGLLVTAVPTAPPYAPAVSPLPTAAAEADLLKAHFSGPCTTLIGAEATRSSVVRAMRTHPYVHFACHGGQDLSDPSSNALYLYDGPLRLTDLITLDLEPARLAVLSACETALGGYVLPDEAVHLGAAFHVIGYRQVVATLWSVNDRTAPTVALAVCENPRNAAEAVHCTTRHLRDQHLDDPMAWVPFLHIGA
ncbi:CHAT domain-containing protein [Streptomyces sp. NPDC057136]|uniref:CHAT domain-containing protein n=1 Tax=Streptomyces sp. NPDC057136 TaxID=3346029 RepID=UPI0036346BEB